VVHQQLRAFLAGRDPLSSKVMAAHIAESQMNADATRQAERLSRRHHTLRFIAAQPERVWDAVVVDRRGAQATLLIPDLAFDVQVNTPAAPGTALQVQFADIDLPQMRVRARSV